ncbi:histone-like nucleoid-structuring protein Lsr2, partial [Rhodococcus sp. NPDC057014]|uniref:Lsr2 family DNA-binding protein n=1 Tax=Rhodococcus sp. NPDC057014 TaxID=3346000 RepID=UPI00362DECE0
MAVSPRGSEGSTKRATREIREWAIGMGLAVSSRGRISAEVERAFHEAQVKKVQAKKVQAKTTPAKKGVVKKTVAAKTPVKQAAVSTAPPKKTSREIREWAIGAGHVVSSRGRIPVEIEQAFH